MSNIVRQENLFAAEDFTKIYKSFQNVSFRSYDFDDLKTTLINYIRTHFPEDFNDYVESSEFIAIIELLSFLGTSLAFRIDLNSRENILDTAQRRESIVRLARMINYRPKRNIAASGLFKLSTIQIDQPITDSVGKSLNGVPITWADPNNPDWFDQFITILNAVFKPVNPFGHPSKSKIVGGVPTDLYELNNVLGINVAHPISISVNGEDIPIDIVNPDIDVSIEERHPNQSDPFNLIYRNDSLGIASSGTGFFLKFKQGSLKKEDFRYDFPEPNKVQPIGASNINESDVHVQEINDDGSVNTVWVKVPAVAGNNIIFNSIAHNERNIFEVIPENDNRVSIKFADGNFGNVPTGVVRVWHRTSLNRTVAIRPEDVQNKSISLTYVGPSNEFFNFNMAFGLESIVANGSPAETNEEIKLRAPQVFYTQQRMINNEDYNVLPLAFGNQILKARAINRTHAGHSRYIDINDPTGFHQNLILYGDDGAIYREDSPQREVIPFSELPDTLETDDALIAELLTFLPSDKLRNFFYAFYIPAAKGVLPPVGLEPDFLSGGTFGTFWKTAPDIFKNDTGFFSNNALDPFDSVVLTDNGVWRFITDGSIIKLTSETGPFREISTSVKSITNAGFPKNPDISDIGPIELATEVPDNWIFQSVIPVLRTTFTITESDRITEVFKIGATFGLGYDIGKNEWYIINNPVLDESIPFKLSQLTAPDRIDQADPESWLVAAVISNSGDSYEFISRGITYIFESLRTVRFYFDAEQRDLDLNTGRAREDVIEILADINTGVDSNNETLPLPKSLLWKIDKAFIQNDGFRDPVKVEILQMDLNEDNVPDVPESFEQLVFSNDTPSEAPGVPGFGFNEVMLRKFTDLDGYEKTRLWLTDWIFEELPAAPFVFLDISDEHSQTINEMGFKVMEDIDKTGTLVDTDFVHFPIISGELFGLLNQEVLDSQVLITNPGSGPDRVEGIIRQLEDNVNTGGGILIANTKRFLDALGDKTFLIGDQAIGSPTRFRRITDEINPDTLIREVSSEIDEFHLSRRGRTITQNTAVITDETSSFNFKWTHIAPADHRIDPSVSNIVDITVLSNTYFTDVLIWKDEKRGRDTFPVPPSTSELRVQFAELDNFKSISDQIIYTSGAFKLLFGRQADPELRAKFIAVKIPSATISDSELKTRIIQAVDAYFNINNWDFGERFFYTELAAFIHTTLSKFLGSVVLVPRKGGSKFGTLFEITSGPNELFMSTATVADVEIAKNLTGTQLQI